MISSLSRAEIFAVLGILVSVIRYGTYLRSIFHKETKPHVFSWLIWGLVVGIGAVAQFKLGAGPSVWVLLVVSVSCLMIAGLAVFVGEKNITRSDWLALLGTIIAIALWQFTDNPVLALICIIIIDSLSYWPTIRKSWANPWDEPPKSYFWAGLRYFCALFAVPEATWDNLFYPLFLMVTDWGFMLYLFWRQRVLPKPSSI